MSRQAIIDRESRLRPFVVVASILPLLLLVGAAFAQSSGGGTSDLATETLRTINENSGSILLGSVLGGIAFFLLILPLVYLFRAAQARSEKMLGGFVILSVLAPFLFGLQGILLAVGQIDVAKQFVDQESGVGDIYSLSTNLLEDNGLRSAAVALSSIALIAMIFAMVYTCLWGSRTGLITRFQGTLGMALGASFILPPLTQVTLPALLAWFMYFGLMVGGRTPKGRPPAWDAGEAVPWPAPGEEPAEPRSRRDDVIEGDASEIPGVGEVNPNAARRERAKKRKRKRRG